MELLTSEFGDEIDLLRKVLSKATLFKAILYKDGGWRRIEVFSKTES
jgi:hypothetical protein